MKILIKPTKYIEEYKDIDGLILPLKNFSVDYETYYTIDEIKKIRVDFKNEIFVVINRMMMNSDIENLTKILQELDTINITGVFFYDLAVLELKKELNLKLDLVWNATHMTTNYKTCNYYYDMGVKYVYLANEITLDEVLEINNNSKIIPMFTMISYPTVAMSYRHLITNYNKMHNLSNTNKLEIKEKITQETYNLTESEFGTTFKYGKVLNNVESLDKLKENKFPYIVLIEDGIKNNTFIEILDIIKDNIENNSGVEKIYDLVGNNTGFLNKKTVYKVKKDD